MNRKISDTIAFRTFVLGFVLSAAWQGQAQDLKAAHPSMAPVAQYLMADQNAEIAMARSAAPAAISRDAKILVLGRRGYETAVEGKSGFVCLIDRSWMGPFGSLDFWNPRVLAPVCLNPPAARSILPISLKRAELALAGLSTTQMIAGIKEAVEKKELTTPEHGAIGYMMSKDSYFGDSYPPALPHMMFYLPETAGSQLGADVPNSPVHLTPSSPDDPEPGTTFIVLVGNWSDGTPAASAPIAQALTFPAPRTQAADCANELAATSSAMDSFGLAERKRESANRSVFGCAQLYTCFEMGVPGESSTSTLPCPFTWMAALRPAFDLKPY